MSLEELNHELVQSCYAADYKKFSSILKEHNLLQVAPDRAQRDAIFKFCYENGYFDFVKLIYEQVTCKHLVNDEFVSVVSFGGYLDLLKWSYEINPYLNFKANDSEALRFAAKNGHYDVVVYLCAKGAQASDQDWFAFRWACVGGYLKIAKYLVDYFDVDVYVLNNFAFREACAGGHLEVAKWLKTNWPDINPRADKDYAFKWAVLLGQLEVAKWLKTNWPEIDHRANDDELFCELCRSSAGDSNFEMVEWFVNYLDIKPTPTICKMYDQCLEDHSLEPICNLLNACLFTVSQ